jgi:hypothetical protein
MSYLTRGCGELPRLMRAEITRSRSVPHAERCAEDAGKLGVKSESSGGPLVCELPAIGGVPNCRRAIQVWGNHSALLIAPSVERFDRPRPK